MRGHDNQAGHLPREEHSNGQSSVVGSMRQTRSSQASRLRPRSVVRRIDTWSVLKVSVVFYIAVYCILLVASSLLWFAATQTGLRENVEKVIADLIASGKFHFVGGELLRAGAIGGAILVVLGAAGNVMLSVLYNLISDLVGGVSIVVEEQSLRRVGRVPANDSVQKPPAVEPHHTTTELASPEPVKILVPQVERTPEPTHPEIQAPRHPDAQPAQPQPARPQARQPDPRPQPRQLQPKLSQPPEAEPQPLPPEQPQSFPPQPRPQAQPSQPAPQPQAQPTQQPQPQQPQSSRPQPSQPAPLPISAPSPEMPDQQLLGPERAADGNLEAFGL